MTIVHFNMILDQGSAPNYALTVKIVEFTPIGYNLEWELPKDHIYHSRRTIHDGQQVMAKAQPYF